jgi:hypothetical protein
MEERAPTKTLYDVLLRDTAEAAALEQLDESEEALLQLQQVTCDTVNVLAVLPPDEAGINGCTERFLDLLTQVRRATAAAIGTVREPWPLEGYDLHPGTLRKLLVHAERTCAEDDTRGGRELASSNEHTELSQQRVRAKGTR